MKKRVAVLLGGISSEREVSIATGNGIADAVERLGYPCTRIDVGPSITDLISKLKVEKTEVALIGLHGKYAEDGIIQSVLEYERIPYSGSGVGASALCMNKVLSKEICEIHGIKSANFVLAKRGEPIPEIPFSLPFVVKPNTEGSSVGLNIVKDKNNLQAAFDDAFKYDELVLVEEFIPGAEIAVPIFRGKAIETIEIAPKSGTYDYASKYTTGATDYYVPARISPDLHKKILELAWNAFTITGCRQYGRVDFKLKNDEPLFLEINTLPGCTPTSLVPKGLINNGISFDEFVKELIETSRCDY